MQNPRLTGFRRAAVFVTLFIVVLITIIAWRVSREATAVSTFRDWLASYETKHRAEQSALLLSLFQRSGREDNELLAHLGASRRHPPGARGLVWWGVIGGVDTSPLRVYLFETRWKPVSSGASPLICVVTDEERRLLSWRTVAANGRNLWSVEAVVGEMQPQLLVRTTAVSGFYTYSYDVTSAGICERGVDRKNHNVFDKNPFSCCGVR
jgi:hypothetical protein